MFLRLVLKELHDHLLSLRFQAGFLLALVLVSASAFVLSSNYQRQSAAYFERLHQEDEFLRKYAHLNRLSGALMASRAPAPMVLVRGIPDEAGLETLDGDPMQELFPPMDLPVIAAVIFSLLGIVLGFDAINGERESGTLRLVLANSLKRFEVLAAKWLGGVVLLVLVIPNASPYVAAQFVRITSVAALERDLRFIRSEERDQVGRALQQKALEKYRGLADFGDAASEETKRRIATDPAFRRLYEQMRQEVQAAWDGANRIQNQKAERMLENYRTLGERQFDLSQRISFASPLPPLVYASTELARAGFGSRQHLQRQAEAYRSGLYEYAWRRLREEQRTNPAFGVNDFLDVSTRPRFAYQPLALAARWEAAQKFFAMLAGWNALLFLGAAVGFLRFDVR